MDLDPHLHFEKIIEPQTASFIEASNLLHTSKKDKDEINIERFTFLTLREGSNAIWHTHHFADLLFSRKHQRPSKPGQIKEFIDEVQSNALSAKMYNSEKYPDGPMSLLADTADALKHAILRGDRLVGSNDRVLFIKRGFGTGGFGTGGFGGSPLRILSRDKDYSVKQLLETCNGIWKHHVDSNFPKPNPAE